MINKFIKTALGLSSFFNKACMNKNYLLGGLAVLGLLATLFSAWARITHQPYQDTALLAGKIGQGVGLVALTLLLFFWMRKKN